MEEKDYEKILTMLVAIAMTLGVCSTTNVVKTEEEVAGIIYYNVTKLSVRDPQNLQSSAYLYMDDIKVDYPVLQHESDNSHYLNYTIDGKQGYLGSIYSEKETSKKFDVPNTIIFGYNMSVAYGIMFYDLIKYERKHSLMHIDVYMYTPDAIYQYEIFAAYSFDNRHLLYSYDFKDKEVFKSYLDEVFHMGNGIINQEIKVTNENKVLTLSTCTKVRDEERFLVQVVLKERVICKYKSAVETTHTMKGMKNLDILQMEENKNKISLVLKIKQW